MAMVSSTVGSAQKTCWNLRSRAASFSIYLRYSSRVVAPITCMSPRARAGLRRFPASMLPSEAPAPTIVWSSSMNRIIWPSLFETSVITALSLSSNSPRNFAPATRDPMSRERSLLSLKLSGTSPPAIRRARPSTIAVFPTPGSPMRTGLFFVRRLMTCMTRRISSSRPMTGSILSMRARAVRSMQYFSRERILLSGSWLSTLWLPRTFFKASRRAFLVHPTRRRVSPTWSSDCAMARRMCSTERNWSLRDDISFSAFARTFWAEGDKAIWVFPRTTGYWERRLSI